LDLFSVIWPSLVGYPLASFVMVTGLGIIVHVKWLELRIFWRSHFQYRKQDGGQNAEHTSPQRRVYAYLAILIAVAGV